MMRSLLIVGMVSILGFQAQAARTTKKKVKTEKVAEASETSTSFAPKKGRLGTDFSFAGSRVDGKYLSAGESIAEVEDEKGLDNLIGIRKNFRDRLGNERARLKAEGK